MIQRVYDISFVVTWRGRCGCRATVVSRPSKG